MKVSSACPENIEESSSYYCPVLCAERSGREEEICSFCPELQDQLRDQPRLSRAVRYAADAHRGQCRKGTQIPYLIHLLRTWDYVRQMTDDVEEWEAAVLHDILEDTAITCGELREKFGERVAELVQGESEEKREDCPAPDTWILRKAETICRLRQWVEDEGRLPSMHIAFGDKLANLYSMMYEYRYAGEQIWKKFNQKEKEKHAWYYGEMGRVFSAFFRGGSEKRLVGEYWSYYKEVFGRYEVSGM